MNGVYDSSDLIPVLLFSVGVPWVEPCLRHVCCLWDVLERYRDHALMDALGSPCDEHVNLTTKDLTRGNGRTNGQWEVDTMIHPSFVVMLFLCLGPVFYMYYEIVPVEWESGSVRWSSAWYGQPCHQVTYTDGRKLCIYCMNEKPDNARFMFTPNWFQTFQCKWECLPGFMGPGCELSTGLVASIGAGAMGLLCVGFVGVLIFKSSGTIFKSSSRNVVEKTKFGSKPVVVAVVDSQQSVVSHLMSIDTPSLVKATLVKAVNNNNRVNDVISFKDDGFHEIRIKLL